MLYLRLEFHNKVTVVDKKGDYLDDHRFNSVEIGKWIALIQAQMDVLESIYEKREIRGDTIIVTVQPPAMIDVMKHYRSLNTIQFDRDRVEGANKTIINRTFFGPTLKGASTYTP